MTYDVAGMLTYPQAWAVCKRYQFTIHATPQVDLFDRLSGVLPSSLDQYFLANSGAEAVDNAVKIAKAATGRPNVIAFEVRLAPVPEGQDEDGGGGLGGGLRSLCSLGGAVVGE